MKHSGRGNRFVGLTGQLLEDRNAPALFGPADNSVPVGVQPQSVAVADFNGDGRQDFAVANVNGNELTILFGDGNGGFTPATGSPITINRPYSVAAGDFNGDGAPDLAVANNFGAAGTITALLGDGNGGFGQTVVATGHSLVSVAVGDFNGDGILDLAGTNNVSNGTVTVLVGNGNGGFNPVAGSPFAVGNGPRSVAVGDFNGDGKQDLAVSNFGSNDVTVLAGNGAGGFSSANGSPIGVGANPEGLAVGDFNGDGIEDLAVPNAGSDNLTVLLGSAAGGFSSAAGSPLAVGSDPVSVAVADFNGDGKQDVAVTCYGSSNLSILLGNGGGGFGAADSPVATGTGPYFVAADDFNADGRSDLAVANYIDNDLSIYLNHGGVRITEPGSAVVSESGQTQTYTVVLNSQPSSDVTVSIDGGSQLSTDVTSVTFTPANWNVPRSVTVSAVDDFVAEGDHSGTITHAVSSTDPNFNGVSVAGVSAAILDNDHAGVVVEEGGGIAVAEGGATDAYTIQLASQPTADVVISISTDSQVTTTPLSLTFTAADWNVPQIVTVAASDDSSPEGQHVGVISHAAGSLDPMYQGLGLPPVVADVTDDDPGVLVTASAGSTDVSEGGETDTYALALSTRPTADVVITASGDGQVDGTPGTVTFTPGNWKVPQTVTMTAVDDLVAEGTHTGTISHLAASADSNYNGVGVPAVLASVTDNDTAGIVVTPTSGLLTREFGTTATFTVVLTSRPTAEVAITVESSDPAEGTVAPTVLVFTPANALTPQTVTITGVDDPRVDGDVPYTVITNPASSADPNYSGRDSADVPVTNLDDDAPAPANTAVVREDDGDKVTWRLRGPGTLVFSQADPDSDGVGPVRSLYVTGTDPKKSNLTLSVARARGTGDGLTTIAEISGSDLRAISAARANLIGRGVNIAGSLRALTIRDIEHGADVLAVGAPTLRTTITARDIGDGTAVAFGSRIGRLTAARFGQGTITAPSIGTLNIRGDSKAGLPADFRGSVSLTGTGISPGRPALAAVNVRGTVTGASFRIGGTVNSFRSGAFLDSQFFVGFDPTDSANPLAGGTFTGGLTLRSFTVTGLKDSTAPAFDNSFVGADTIGWASLKSIDPGNATAYGLVAHHIAHVTVRDSGFRFDPSLPSPQGDGSFQVWVL